MINKLITHDRIKLVDSVEDWVDAINLVCAPLIKDNSISSNYKKTIINTTIQLGPYYVLAPGIAMPHARPEQGVNNNALSLLVVRNGVKFNSSENDPVQLILLLAAKDSNQHIELITSISELFCNSKDIEKISKEKEKRKIIEIISKY